MLSGKQGDMILSRFVTQRNYTIGVQKRGVADCGHRDLALEDTIASAYGDLTGETYSIDGVPWESKTNFLNTGETTGISSMRYTVD
ncbi:hypothetical protein SARC_01704 [Sphaeroforma arctica JP610]|uniref:Uncharacterized protein n=1 Tax=Sphaeroforma arctica JP610 TaxID=667725 RepID=A0A0L0GAX5_9EUKA|nr:hypothetical protein SARC_01704 [Sphaeroforma arctica JP610]KNC86135.1 hypothetical protein SARC_01704 [Sphaeroforma arctica JP610]|eukprot:XP_014160037.1 hypothetical protein SARC_01704 [Sphaeroforma arctica JP610]